MGVGSLGQQRFNDAVNDEVGIAANGRGEVSVAGRGEGNVAFVLLAVAGRLKRAQHQVGEDALFGFTGNFGGKPLVHLRSDGDLLGDLMVARLVVMAALVASATVATLLFAAVG